MSEQAMLALTREMRAAREDLKAIRDNGDRGIPRGWIKWILGIVGGLIVIGVVSNIRTYSKVQADVQSLSTNVSLLRVEVQREFDRQTRDIDDLETKVDSYLASTRGGGE